MRANSARFVLAGESFLIQTKRNESLSASTMNE